MDIEKFKSDHEFTELEWKYINGEHLSLREQFKLWNDGCIMMGASLFPILSGLFIHNAGYDLTEINNQMLSYSTAGIITTLGIAILICGLFAHESKKSNLRSYRTVYNILKYQE